MKIHSITQDQINNKQTNFKGIADEALKFLATNQGVGANLTDIGFMVAPRVATDSKRGPAAGLETLRREASGTANHSMIGVYGLAGGGLMVLLMGINKEFGIKANSMFTAPETLNILAEKKANQIKDKKSQLEYLKEVLSSVKAYNPSSKQADKDGFIKIKDNVINEVAEIINKALNDEKIDFKKWYDKKSADSLYVALNKIMEKTGAESKYIIESADGKIKNESNLQTLLEDIYKISDSFNKEKVKKAFETQVEKGVGVAENAYIKKFNRFMKSRSAIGFLIGTAVGMSVQPLNIYLTKKKTGSDGFVGVEGRSKDNSTEFKIMKGVSAVGFGGLTLATLGTGFKGFMDKMAFKGFWPTISQLKGIYGLTIISRLLATRDKDELRESLTKDFLGFLSWLVLGDVVNRITAESLDKSVMNRTKEIENKGFFKRIFNSSLKTRDEILMETLAEHKISTVKKDGDKVIAKTFKELLKELDNVPEQAREIAKKRLRTLNKAQLVGYAFSGLVLGLGIPNLNIYITNKLDKQRKAKMAEQQVIARA